MASKINVDSQQNDAGIKNFSDGYELPQKLKSTYFFTPHFTSPLCSGFGSVKSQNCLTSQILENCLQVHCSIYISTFTIALLKNSQVPNEFLSGCYKNFTTLNFPQSTTNFFKGFQLHDLGMDILNISQVKYSEKVLGFTIWSTLNRYQMKPGRYTQ